VRNPRSTGTIPHLGFATASDSRHAFLGSPPEEQHVWSETCGALHVGVLATGKVLANRAAEVECPVAADTDVDRRLIYYGDRRRAKSAALEEAAIRAPKK
jgi:hypothetical protein